MNVPACVYMGGYSGHPQRHDDSNALWVDAGGLSYRGFREIFRLPWPQISDLRVDEHDSPPLPAERLFTTSLFGARPRKNRKSALLLVDLQSGGRAVFYSDKMTAGELSTKLEPIISRLHAAVPHSARGPVSVVAELMRLRQLCDHGLLTEEQFEARRERLLGG